MISLCVDTIRPLTYRCQNSKDYEEGQDGTHHYLDAMHGLWVVELHDNLALNSLSGEVLWPTTRG